MDLPGYEIVQELSRNQARLTCRALRRRDGQTVLLATQLGGAEPLAIDAIAREFDLLRELSLPGIPRVVDFARGDSAAGLVMEDRGLRPLTSRPSGAPLDVGRFLRVAVGACTALADLHRADAIHGGLSPTAIWASADGRDVQLMDFSSAWRGSSETRPDAARHPDYISPEQTGRISQPVDYRADFYSLGAVLYELLTGRPPFHSEDSLEVIHAHLARTAASPTAVAPDVPEALSAIILKLLEKAPDDRYQSAAGVRADLETCERQWNGTGAILPFPVAQHDVAERLRIPQRLYGRDREIRGLLTAFDDTCHGGRGLMLVSGYPGIGKTALIHELFRPIVRRRGCFISGKFDQVVRGTPYGAVIQAFSGLVRQLLTENETRLAAWRGRLSGALGANGGVLAEVIPEITLVIGEQEPPPPLDPAEAQNRFRFVFQNFVGAMAQADHPLVIFLDDVQWADQATLDLLAALVTGEDIQHLLLVAAYRDNEVAPGHPLMRAIDALEASGTRVGRLGLTPLPLAELLPFLRDTLHGDPGAIDPLARLIQQKTDGNPFFVIQFLKTLEQEGFFQFDRGERRWTYRLDAIARAGMTDNVVDLLTRKIERLSPRAQSVLTLAACIGNQFDWKTFLTVSRMPGEDAAAGLREVLDAGLAQRIGDDPYAGQEAHGAGDRFGFLHDRVQQAAYGLIPDTRKQAVHLDIGRLLLTGFDADESDDRLFEIVGQLTMGSALIVEPAERLRVARLTLAAGRKAKTSTAYGAATDYFDQGIRLLAAPQWQTDYDLAFALHLEAAECRYLTGAFERAEEDFRRLLERAASPLDKAQVHSLRVTLYENQSRWADALASGREALALFGLEFPMSDADKAAALDREVDTAERHRGDRPIASLVDLPPMADPTVRMTMRTLTILWASAYISGDQLLARLISATMVRLSLEHGNTEDSAYGYVTHAITVGVIRGNYREAYEWGELALGVNQRFDDRKRRAKIHQQFQAHVNLWRRPFHTGIAHAREACRSGLESGDFTYAGYGAATEAWSAWIVNRSLERFVHEYSPHLSLLAKIRMTDFFAAHKIVLNWALALQGRTAGRLALSDATFDEHAFVAAYERTAPFFLTFYYTARLHLLTTVEEYGEATEVAARARAVVVPGTIWPVLVDFWGGLAAAGALATAPEPKRPELAAILERSAAALRSLEPHCPENFRGFSLLLDSELARVEGRTAAAADLCERAAAHAHQARHLQQEALAHEMAGRAWLSLGDTAAASRHMIAAHRSYAEWGATVKVAQIEQKHGDLLPTDRILPRAVQPSAAVEVPAASALDVASVLKLASAIAAEITLEGLLRKMIAIAVENAGAQRGIFLDDRGDGRLSVEAAADPDRIEVRQGTALEDASLATSVVRYVQRTGQSVVTGNAPEDERFAGDAYLAEHAVKSVLCVPIAPRGRRAGILYLENRLTANAFTPDRLELMRIVASQAAISLENARLYEGMKTEIDRRTAAEQALRAALAELGEMKERLEVENVYLQEEIRTQHNFNEIVGNDHLLLEMLRKVERVAPTDSTVLILGETGSGKELVARAIHSRSRRADRPLVKVNCGAIAPGLVESELFGHVRGAFTGAIEKRIGRFEVANGGTIFLDEVGELPAEAQVKLLRVLQEQEFEPVGSSRTVRVNIRVIAATNRDLEEAVREKRFRADLLYRLNVFPIEVPSLRDRKSDIRLLVGFFVAGLARKLGKNLQGFSARSMQQLMAYSWPGNVRELQNVVERAAILAHDPIMEVDPSFFAEAPPRAMDPPLADVTGTLDDAQRAHIRRVLQQTQGVVEGPRGAANVLGLHPNTLRSRMKKLGIGA